MLFVPIYISDGDNAWRFGDKLPPLPEVARSVKGKYNHCVKCFSDLIVSTEGLQVPCLSVSIDNYILTEMHACLHGVLGNGYTYRTHRFRFSVEALSQTLKRKR